MSSSQRRSSPTDSGEGQYAEVVQPGVPVTPRQYSGLPTPNHPEDSRLLASPSVATGFAHQQEQLLTSQEYIEVNRGGVVGRSGSAGSFVPTNASPLGANSRHTPAPNPNSASYPSSTSSSVSASNPFVGGGAPLPRSVTGSGSRPASRGSFRAVSNSSHGFASAHSNHELSSDGVITTLGLGSGPHTSAFPPSLGTHGSMVLYRLADSTSGSTKSAKSASGSEPLLLPPRMFSNRNSVASSSGDSIMSLADSKYPSGPGGMGDRGLGVGGSVRGLIPYAYDPFQDDGDADEEDYLHDPNAGLKNPQQRSPRYDKDGQSTPAPSKKKIVPIGPDGKPYHAPKSFPWRGVVNFSVLIFLVLALLSLFLLYPLLTFFRDEKRNEAIEGNIRINATGQAAVLFQMPELVDPETPDSAKSRTGFDGFDYELVFSDEFNKPGRTFYPGDDPFWEAVDLWYGSTQDLEWYDPLQVTTRDGALVITMDSTSTTQAGVTPNSTAPFTEADNHGLDYRSGMLQSWNKFCFTTGYIEVSVTFPGPDQSTQGYWPGAWTMGNLGRPGYLGSTDGMWPYTYDSCDVGTFPNQTYKDGSGPAAALHSDKSRSTNNFELSWLSGQRVSACTCPGGDHPGPSVNKGRGAPEIDIFETEKDKNIPIVQVVSQSSQFGPFAHDYQAFNDTGDWTNFNTTTTRGNTFHGSAVQQSISALTVLPEDMFQGSGAVYHTLGFEYWSDPNNRQDGVITWQVDGQKTHQVTAAAVGPDPLPNGSGVSQRLISEEPMSIVLNLGISKNWQTIDLTTMIFPAELKFDYVRVYQRKGQQNYGCSPPNYPTSDYINNHPQAYFDVNATAWPYEKPKNSMYDGC